MINIPQSNSCANGGMASDAIVESLKEGKLLKEIVDFIDWVSPTIEERKMRSDIIERIGIVVKQMWPEARMEVIGSNMTDLCVPTSDVDLVIFGASASSDSKDCIPHLYKLSSKLQQSSSWCDVRVIPAKVPIVKLKDLKSGTAIDIAFEVVTGTENTKIIQKFLDQFPLVKPLTLIVKYYLKECYLNDTWTGGIGSYTLVIMIISYLQWYEREHGRVDQSDLAKLLVGFFEYYGTKFDYLINVISVTQGGKIITKTSRKWFNENNPELLSVEDPQNPDIDVGLASFKITQAKSAFMYAYSHLTGKTNEKGSCLSQLIRKSHMVLKHRQNIKEIYGDDCLDQESPLRYDNENNVNQIARSNEDMSENWNEDKNERQNGYGLKKSIRYKRGGNQNLVNTMQHRPNYTTSHQANYTTTNNKGNNPAIKAYTTSHQANYTTNHKGNNTTNKYSRGGGGSPSTSTAARTTSKKNNNTNSYRNASATNKNNKKYSIFKCGRTENKPQDAKTSIQEVRVPKPNVKKTNKPSYPRH